MNRLREIAEETMRIIASGGYQTTAGADVRVAPGIALAVAGTRMYRPDDPLPGAPDPESSDPPDPGGSDPPVIEVTRETTLAAARRAAGVRGDGSSRGSGAGVACLVYASAKNPGGGFRNGAQAQEEGIARASALYACQTSTPEFYDFHRRQRDLRYSDRVIYSPAVPVFRDDHDVLLPQPYQASFLTAAAPNLGAIVMHQPSAADSVPDIIRRRAARVLDIAHAHQHRELVLGAWGCGVFRNDAATVATAFARILRGDRRFGHIVFAVYDRLPGTPVYGAFANAFRS